MELSQLAILLGIANGVVLLLKPLSRLHDRVDSVETRCQRLEETLAHGPLWPSGKRLGRG